jgi:hypothetical protein
MIIPEEKPVPIICQVCEMIDGDVLEKAIAEGSFLAINEGFKKLIDEEGENDPPEVFD